MRTEVCTGNTLHFDLGLEILHLQKLFTYQDLQNFVREMQIPQVKSNDNLPDTPLLICTCVLCQVCIQGTSMWSA